MTIPFNQKAVDEQIARFEGVEFISELLTRTNFKVTFDEIAGAIARERDRLRSIAETNKALADLREKAKGNKDPLLAEAISHLEQALLKMTYNVPKRL